MSTERTEETVLQTNVKQATHNDEVQLADLSVFPKPTVAQLEEVLEERVFSDRRSDDAEIDFIIERRIQQRRCSS